MRVRFTLIKASRIDGKVLIMDKHIYGALKIPINHTKKSKSGQKITKLKCML